MLELSHFMTKKLRNITWLKNNKNTNLKVNDETEYLTTVKGSDEKKVKLTEMHSAGPSRR